MFGVKDLFTTFNLVGGVVAVLLCLGPNPHPVWAGWAILIGYVGDALDGWVARKLGTSNRFGGEYDAVSDHLSHCIAPAIIYYVTQKDAALGLGAEPTRWLAGAMCALMIVVGTIRHARNLVRPVEMKGVWGGLNRTVMGFLVLGYSNSQLWPLVPGGAWFGVALVVACSILALTYVPFTSHRRAGGLRVATRVAITLFFVSTFGVLIFAPAWAFDVLFFWIAGYTLGATSIVMSAEEKRAWWDKVAEAKARGEV
jgi:phosphatidylserine synthase